MSLPGILRLGSRNIRGLFFVVDDGTGSQFPVHLQIYIGITFQNPSPGMQALYGEKQIIALLQKIRIFNKEIGCYEQFALTEHFDYAVKLSNGRIVLKPEDLKKDEKNELKPYHLEAIADRFIPASESNHKSGAIENAANLARIKFGRKIRKTVSFTFMFLVIILAGLAMMNRSSTSSTINAEKKETAGEQPAAQRSNAGSANSKPKTTKTNAADWLSATGSVKKNLWGNKLKAEVSIKNNSSSTSYSNLVLRATYINKQGKQIASRDHTIVKNFSAGGKETVQLKIENFQHVHSVTWSVVSADILK